MKSKFRFLSLLLALIMVFSLAGSALAEDPVVQDLAGQLVILHTNDVHSRVDDNLGYATVAAAKTHYESRGADVLLLDAGDTLHGLPIANLSQGESIVDIMNAVGYDAMTPGNHDYNFGTDRLVELVENSMNFPLLSANYTAVDSTDTVFDASAVFTLSDGTTTVGVIGLSTPETTTKSSPKNTEGYTFNPDDMADILQAEIDALEADGVDYIVTLGHLGIDEESTPWRSTDVIAEVSGLDIFIDGHSHSTLTDGLLIEGEDGNDVLLASTGNYLNNIGVITVDGAGAMSAELLNSGITPDADIATLISDMKTALAPQLNTVVAETSVVLNGERTPNRTMETNLGDLATDALRYVSGADVALTNGGGIRVSLPAGDITYGDLNAVFPFGNVVVTIDITGADLLAALEHGTASTPAASGGFPQVSGITFDVNTYLTENRVTNVMVGGEPLDLEATYTLATNDFTQVGGDGYTMLAGYTVSGYYGALDEALVEYVDSKLGGVIGEEYVAPQGRIVIKPTPFKDIVAGDWFFDSVTNVYLNGIMVGTSNDTFSPNNAMSREMMITILYRLEGAPAPARSASAYFSDVQDGRWYSDALAWAYEKGITDGVGRAANGKIIFSLGSSITREQLATAVFRYADLLGLVPDDMSSIPEPGFTDWDSVSGWAQEAIIYCADAGLVNGIGNNRFAPQSTSTRAQAATLTSRFMDFAFGA